MIRTKLRLLLWFLPLLLGQAQAGQAQLSEAEYHQLNSVFPLMEQGQWVAARQQWVEVGQKVRSDYARALVYHNLAQVSLQLAQFQPAINYLKQARALDALPPEQMLNLQHTLGQLYCSEAEWKNCIREIGGWIQHKEARVKAEDHLLLAQANAQLERWREVLPPVKSAISQRKLAPASWYLLQIAAHVQLQQWKSAVRQQQLLVRHYADKPEYWRQLVSLQVRQGAEAQALATHRLGYQRGLLKEARDFRLLAQLLLNQQLPYVAAEVLEAGLKQGVLSAKPKHLELLANAWIRAREDQRAIPVLTRLQQQSPRQANTVRLAQLHLKASQWRSAEQLLVKALQKAPANPAQLQLLLGIARVNMKQYEQARRAFADAAREDRYSQSVTGWMRYLEQLEAASERQG